MSTYYIIHDSDILEISLTESSTRYSLDLIAKKGAPDSYLKFDDGLDREDEGRMITMPSDLTAEQVIMMSLKAIQAAAYQISRDDKRRLQAHIAQAILNIRWN